MKINKQLNSINNTSLAKVCFYKKPLNNLIKDLHFYNIIFASDGVYIALKNKFGLSIGLIPNIKYSNMDLDSLKLSIGIHSSLPKPKLSVFNEILEMFKYVCNKSNYELCVNLYYDTLNSEFKLSLHDQIISGAKVNYDYDENLELSDRYIRYLQIHSHNTMPAFFSSIDNDDEMFTNLCYYGVIGKISKESKFYNIDMKFRIWNGVNFIDIDFSNVFNVGFDSYELSPNQVQKLDKIIEISKTSTKKILKNTSFDNLNTFIEDDEFFKTLLDERNDYFRDF